MKLSEFELLVFDWDGTLSDSTARIIHSAQIACEELKVPVPNEETLRQYVGHGLDDIMRELFPQVLPHQIAQLIDRYRYHYFSNPQQEYLFKDVISTLETLHARGFLLAVATNKSRQGLQLALEQTGLMQMFVATRTADESGSKPDPQILEDLMEIAAVSAPKTVMIGDSAVDLQLAENAGVSSIAIHHDGPGKVGISDYKPLAIVNDMKSLLDLL